MIAEQGLISWYPEARLARMRIAVMPLDKGVQLWRSVSGQGHLNGSFPPPKEASTRNRLLIYSDTPIQINRFQPL
jgi:hypothetical protein